MRADYTLLIKIPLLIVPTVKLSLFLVFILKGATSQVARIPAVLDQTVIALDRTVITASSHFLRPGGGSDRLWLRRTPRHISTPALTTVSCLSCDRYVYKTLPRAGLFPGARSCAFKPISIPSAQCSNASDNNDHGWNDDDDDDQKNKNGKKTAMQNALNSYQKDDKFIHLNNTNAAMPMTIMTMNIMTMIRKTRTGRRQGRRTH